MEQKQIVMMNIDDVRLDPRNPRRNEVAVGTLMQSIEEFGFRNPIVIDSNRTIIAGNTRYKAAKHLGISEIPCIIADDLTAKELRAYQLADNKTAEIATWDTDMLNAELSELSGVFDMSDFGFEAFDMDNEQEKQVIENHDDDDDCVCCPRCGRRFPKE